MQKIISVFQRNYDGDRLIRDEVVPGAEWVLAGEGVATRKWDGTSCLVRDGRLFKRYDAKHGKTPPAGFVPAQDPDPKTGHWPGWLAVGDGPEDRWHREAWEQYGGRYVDGTYELCGPKVQGNPERMSAHYLVPHGGVLLSDCPRTFDGIRDYLRTADIEGVVFHHPDGRMAKAKTRDFGLKRSIPAREGTEPTEGSTDAQA
jgi:hypothetical protein